MRRFAGLLLVGLVGVALVGCSPAASVTPTPTPPASSGLSLPSPGAVAELEALIPDTIAGVTISKTSLTGSDMIASNEADAASRKFIEELGVAPESVAVAIGFGFAADGSSGVYIFVFRAEGAGHDKLVSVFKSATDETRQTAYAWSSQSIGGKVVEVATDPATGLSIYLYATSDLLFEFSVKDPAAAADLIAALP